MFQKAQALLKTAPAAGRKVERGQDERLYGSFTFDESSPAPSRKWTAAALAQAFRQKRDRIIRYVETTQDPLRSHVDKGGVDAYQWILLIAAHAERHVAQIDALKADPRYPK